MMGRHHVASGLAVGIATLPLLGAQTSPTRAAWVLALGGAALLPDLDTAQSSAARVWGPITRLTAAGVGLVSGGHRRATHDLVLACVGLGGLMWAATLLSGLATVVLALLIGLVLHDIARLRFIGWPLNLLASWLGAGWLLHTHRIDWPLLSLAVVLGVAVHIVGDALTNDGVPVPLLWLVRRRATVGLHLFATGGTIETLLVGPGLMLLVIILTVHHVNHSGGVPADWARQMPTPAPTTHR